MLIDVRIAHTEDLIGWMRFLLIERLHPSKVNRRQSRDIGIMAYLKHNGNLCHQKEKRGGFSR